MGTNIEVHLNEIFSYIKSASLNGLTDKCKKGITNSFAYYQKKLNEHYISAKGIIYHGLGNDSKIFDKYKRAYLTVANVILAKNAEERKEKAKEGIDEINLIKIHFIGKQAKIIKFLKQIRNANDDEVKADLSNLGLKITDTIQIKTSSLNKDILNKIKDGTDDASIDIKK